MKLSAFIPAFFGFTFRGEPPRVGLGGAARARAEVTQRAERSSHAAWNSADLHGNTEILHNYANGPDGGMMSGFLFDILTLPSVGWVDPHKPARA